MAKVYYQLRCDNRKYGHFDTLVEAKNFIAFLRFWGDRKKVEIVKVDTTLKDPLGTRIGGLTMTKEQKLKGIAKYLDDFIKETDDLKNLDKEDAVEAKAQRKLALEIAIRFHLEEEVE